MKSVVKPVLILLATFLVLISVVAVSLANRTTAHAKSTLLPGITNGAAYAGYLEVPAGEALASVGPLFPAGLGCSLSSQSTSATSASMSLGGSASSGAVNDSATTTRTSTSVTTQASANVQGLNILAGLITGTNVTAVANSQATATSATSSGSTTFSGLVVNGKSESSNPPPNTKINLPNLGSVTLNEQIGTTNGANSTSITVIGIDVSVTLQNLLGLPVGTHILIAHAATNFLHTAILASVYADAYGLYGIGKPGSSFAGSGPWADAGVGCAGGSAKTSTAGVNIPVVGSTGAITDTASGVINSSGASANSSSTVQQVNLLSSLITANSVMSSVQVFSNGTKSAMTTLNSAVVNGTTLSANPAANTQINIPGLGYVVVNEQILFTSSTQTVFTVNAFDLYVTSANSFGLPVGTRILVGHSTATVSTG